VRIPHVLTSVHQAQRPRATVTEQDTLELECAARALRNSLWVSLFLAQQLRQPGFQDDLSKLLRDCDRRIAELELEVA